MDQQTQATKGERWSTRFSPSNGRVLVDTSGNIWSEADMKAGIPLGPGEWDLLLDQIEESTDAPEPRGEPEPSEINAAIDKLRDYAAAGDWVPTITVCELLDLLPPEGWKEAPEPAAIVEGSAEHADLIERFRKALMMARSSNQPMESISEAAHICAAVLAVPPSPRTEKVPWHEALFNERKVAFPNPSPDDLGRVTFAVAWEARNADDGLALFCNGKAAMPIDADGCVLVLARSDEGEAQA